METTADAMCINDRMRILLENIKVTKEYYRRQKNQHKTGTVLVNTFTILASGMSTIFIGWKPADDGLLNWALVTSTIATAIILLNSVFDYKNVWVTYKVAILELNLLADKVKSCCPMVETKLDDFEQQYENICERVTSEYKRIRTAAPGVQKVGNEKKPDQ
jgi:hypothetical protein